MEDLLAAGKNALLALENGKEAVEAAADKSDHDEYEYADEEEEGVCWNAKNQVANALQFYIWQASSWRRSGRFWYRLARASEWHKAHTKVVMVVDVVPTTHESVSQDPLVEALNRLNAK